MRELSYFSNKTFDVLVIGGGIVGAGVAWDAALRGLKVALVEKSDYGGATSAGCFKIVHGGLRYLQHFDFKRIIESVREQQILRTIAPHFVHPMPFLVPCYGRGLKGKEALRLGLMLYEVLSFFKNKGVEDTHKLPRFKILTKQECLAKAPGLDKRHLTGGVIYYDCQMSNCERLTYSVIKAAQSAGAITANYLEAKQSVNQSTDSGDNICRVVLKDHVGGREIEVSTRYVVNASGPWGGIVAEKILGIPPKPAQRIFSKGIQVVLPQFIPNTALAVMSDYKDPDARLSRGGRSYFIAPWKGYSLVGTTDSIYQGNPDNFEIGEDDIERFIGEVSTYYKCKELSNDRVLYAFGGLRPVNENIPFDKLSEGDATSGREDEIEVHNEGIFAGKSLTVTGVKYTTFRKLAEKVVDAVQISLKGSASKSRTSETVLPGGDLKVRMQMKKRMNEIGEKLFPGFLQDHLLKEYGAEGETIVDLIEANPALSKPVFENSAVSEAELSYVISNEEVVHLLDVIVRRTELGTAGKPEPRAIKAALELVGNSCGWSDMRKTEEIELLEAWYENKKKPLLPQANGEKRFG